MRRMLVTAALVPAAVAVLALLPANPAAAHPLGNFTVNQYVGVTLHPDHVDALVVVDLAEIPTLQDRPSVDQDGSGTMSPGERSSYAAQRCVAVADGLLISTGPDYLVWTVADSFLDYVAGTGGLETSRLVCRLTVPARDAVRPLARGVVTVENRYLPDRIGWREMTAEGQGVRLIDSPVPTVSVTDELRAYPEDPLAPPLDVRSATVRFVPDAAAGPSAPDASLSDGSLSDGSSSGGSGAAAVAGAGSGSDPVSRWLAEVDTRFRGLASGGLTPLVVLLTAGLAVMLGAGHAALPGHGKTVLAAYLAGKRGRPRDAIVVAGTVTLTHTVGVLALGLLISAGAAFAGERVLSWLGLVSGLVVLVVGAGMLARLVRRRISGHSAGHDHGIGHHDHDHHHRHHSHSHSHGGHVHSHGGHSHGGHSHGGHRHDHHTGGSRGSRRPRIGLAGLGVAGGLVPSPSALIVLLAAIGLGRTGYGILLVLLYGAGMAATLTAAGLVLLAVQRRIARRAARDGISSRLTRVAGRLTAATPAATATLVVLVGVGLAARAGAAIL